MQDSSTFLISLSQTARDVGTRDEEGLEENLLKVNLSPWGVQAIINSRNNRGLVGGVYTAGAVYRHLASPHNLQSPSCQLTAFP